MLTLRPASPVASDSRAILTDYFAFRAAEFPGGAYAPTFPAAEPFTPPSGVFLLAESEDGIVGCGGIRRLDDSPVSIRYEVKHLFLRPATRGLGWGRRVLEELERYAREWGAGELVLDTHHTLDSAGALYARSGFTQIEPYNDNPNATRWYRKSL